MRYMIANMQGSVMSKLRIPSHLGADEIFTHAMYELWKYAKRHGFDTTRDNAIERYLYDVSKKYISKKVGSKEVDIENIPEVSIRPALQFISVENHKILSKIFNSLGTGCKRVLSLKIFKGMKYKEIAEETEYTEGSARTVYSNCLKKLKKQIDDDPTFGDFIKNLLLD